MTHAVRVLHLADLHFGSIPPPATARRHSSGKRSAAHFFVKNNEPDPSRLARILTEDPELSDPPDAVVVAGDVGWSGQDEDYEIAARFFETLTVSWPRAELVVAPGNHDLQRTAPDPRAAQDAFVALLRRIYPSGKFAQRYPLFEPEADNRRDLIASIHEIPDRCVIVTVNSAARVGANGHPVFVSPDTLERLEEKLKRVAQQLPRIAVVHHHLLPFAEQPWGDQLASETPVDLPDPTIVANSAKFQAWMAEHRFQLVLHGHRHTAHGRADTLWRAQDPAAGRRLVILGAGSAGVVGAYRGAEPLSYYVVGLAPLAGARWQVSVRGRKIDDSGGRFAASAYYAFRTETGAPSGEPPFATFQATTTRESHAAIAAAITPDTSVANFLSVVEQHGYEHPPTAKIGAQPATKEQVIDCFRTLHPEWSTTYRDWSNKEAVDDRLRSLPARFQFRHGPRLFGRDFLRGAPISEAPIRQAISTLSTAKKTRAFVSLYRVSDTASDREPMPGLMGVQFIREDRALDVVATFRKLELSFWWAVNMFELDQLLRWAAEASGERLVPRRITFFATIAEWKSDPEAAFVAKLDNLGVENMLPLVMRIARREVPALSELSDLLEEKVRAINEANIDDAGLERLVAVARGIGRTGGTGDWFPPLVNHLEVALGHMKSALTDLDRREPNLDESRKRLGDATTLLRTAAKTRPT